MIPVLPAALPSSIPTLCSSDQVRVALVYAQNCVVERGWDAGTAGNTAPTFHYSEVVSICQLTCPDTDENGEPTGETFTLYWFMTADGTWWDEIFSRAPHPPHDDPRNADAAPQIRPVHMTPSAWLDADTYAAILAQGRPPREISEAPPLVATATLGSMTHYLVELSQDLIDHIVDGFARHPAEDLNTILRRRFGLDHYC